MRKELEEERKELDEFVVSYRNLLLTYLKERFGKITVKSRRTIENTVDFDLLERISRVALKCNDAKEFERKLLELVAN